jgi:SAM-dependent methyltransferase
VSRAARWRAALRRRVRLVTLRGDRVECPCCGRRFRRFLGWGGREDVVCPWCGAFERHRALCVYLRERTDLFSAERRVLHVAPEWSLERNLRALPHLDYVSGDLGSERAMEYLDVTDLPYPDASFDVVLCSHVLEHVRDDRRAMSELARVVRPGGCAILLVPLDVTRAETLEDPRIVTAEARTREYWQADHLRLYGRDFKDRLEEAGFEVTVDRWLWKLDGEIRERYRLAAEDIYVGRIA